MTANPGGGDYVPEPEKSGPVPGFPGTRYETEGNTVRIYGDNRTIHRNESLDVEVDEDGKVVAVWFRCQALPFVQCNALPGRAEEMKRMYEHPMPRIVNVGVIDVR
jgi:hypothetical protein